MFPKKAPNRKFCGIKNGKSSGECSDGIAFQQDIVWGITQGTPKRRPGTTAFFALEAAGKCPPKTPKCLKWPQKATGARQVPFVDIYPWTAFASVQGLPGRFLYQKLRLCKLSRCATSYAPSPNKARALTGQLPSARHLMGKA